MQRIIGTVLGKTVKQATKLRKGSGQALPGLIVERLFPAYFAKMLAQLPEGVIVITGTNGKTTTTKMVTELLRANGKRVLTNPTGSNLTRGINSMLIHQASLRGALPFDIAVLELDEAYARLFTKRVPTNWVLALNVTRDQLDRFGEVDTAARMIIDTMAQATVGIVVNGDDPRLLPAAKKLQAQKQIKLNMFSVSQQLRKFFPTENELVAVNNPAPAAYTSEPSDVTLSDFKDQTVTYQVEGHKHTATLQLNGQHNFQNAAAALALAHALMPSVNAKTLMEQLAAIKPAFGRGEVFRLRNGSSVRLVLVKNPAGFRQSIASYLPSSAPVMIAINDNIADGRDMSWLWDVDFAELRDHTIAYTSGKRAADMALRLRYDDIAIGTVEPDLAKALKAYCQLPGDKVLFTTYTAMLWLHQTLKHKAGTEL